MKLKQIHNIFARYFGLKNKPSTGELGGKKICGVGGVEEYFVWLMLQTLWVSSPLTVAKNYLLFRGSKSNLPMMNAT